jgi:nitrogen regulatory protein PII
MKMVQAIIRNEKLLDVKEALKAIGISGMTVYSVSGWSKGKEQSLQWKGQPIAHDLIGKSKLETIVPDSHVQNVISVITERGRTGAHGDGIVFVMPIEHIVNIMSLEKGENVVK